MKRRAEKEAISEKQYRSNELMRRMRRQSEKRGNSHVAPPLPSIKFAEKDGARPRAPRSMLQVLSDLKANKSMAVRYVSPQSQLLDTMEGLGSYSQQEYLTQQPAEPLWLVQEEAVQFIKRREEDTEVLGTPSALYCDEMGLGKSRSVLQVVLEQNQHECRRCCDTRRRFNGPTLIVCPPILVPNWVQEFRKFPRGSLTYKVVAEAREIGRCPRFLLEHCCDIVLTTYDVLTTACNNNKRYSQLLFEIRYRRLVLDEAHIIVNKNTDVARVCFSLEAECRIAMTGTPVRNRLPDLLTLVHFIGLTGVETPQQLTRQLLDHVMLARTREQVMERQLQEKGIGRRIHCLPELKSVTRRVELVKFRTLPERVLYYIYAKIALQRRLNYRYNTPMLIGLLRQLSVSPAVVKNLVLPGGMLSTAPSLSGDHQQPFFIDQYEATLERAAASDNPVLHFMCQQPRACRIRYRGGEAYQKTDPLYGPRNDDDDSNNDDGWSADIEWDPFCLTPRNKHLVAEKESRSQYKHLYQWLTSGTVNASSLQDDELMQTASLEQTKDSLSHLMERTARFSETASSKERAIVEYVKAVPGDDRVIVFSDYVSVLQGLERAFKSSLVSCILVTGHNTQKSNGALLRRFQADREVKVLLMTLKLGYMGLNLMRDANHIVHTDPWWNPWVTEQADYRIIRPGQLKPIYITYFIMDDTIEVAIMNHTIRKKSILKLLMANGGDNSLVGGTDDTKMTHEEETLLFDYEVEITSLL
jgi:SNF2 family DNA or RNA helicase